MGVELGSIICTPAPILYILSKPIYRGKGDDMSKHNKYLIVIALLSLILLSCLGSGVVRKIAEPIDERGCEWDCQRAGMELADYEYAPNCCYCVDENGEEIKLYCTIEIGE